MGIAFNNLNTLETMTTFSNFAVDVSAITRQRPVFDYGYAGGGFGYSTPMIDPSLNLAGSGMNMIDPTLNLFDPGVKSFGTAGFGVGAFAPSASSPNFNIFDMGGFSPRAPFNATPSIIQPTFNMFNPTQLAGMQPAQSPFGVMPMQIPFTMPSGLNQSDVQYAQNPFASQYMSNPFFDRAAFNPAAGQPRVENPENQQNVKPSGVRANYTSPAVRPKAHHVKGANPPPKYKYTNEINAAAQKYGVDPALVSCIINQESGFKPNVTSGTGAMGLMQLMPATARELGVTNAYDPVQNIDGGTKYIAQLLKKYNGNITKAVAAYNGGMGNIAKYGVGFCSENRTYVERVVGAYNAHLAMEKAKHSS